MKIAVVIPTYNREALIEETIVSCLNQQIDAELRLFVVDDGSRDRTREVLNTIRDERVVVLHQENRERGAARNLGARHAIADFGADWLLFFDSDDKPVEGAFARFVRAARAAKPETVGIYAPILPWDEGQPLPTVRPLPSMRTGDLAEDVLLAPLLPLGATLIRAAAYLSLNGFEEDRRMAGSEDFQFLVRLIYQGEIESIQTPAVYYRRHAGNTNPANYLVSTDLATESLRASTLERWPGPQGLRNFEKLRVATKLCQIGALNQPRFVRDGFTSYRNLVSAKPNLFLQPRVWRLGASLVKTAWRASVRGADQQT